MTSWTETSPCNAAVCSLGENDAKPILTVGNNHLYFNDIKELLDSAPLSDKVAQLMCVLYYLHNF